MDNAAPGDPSQDGAMPTPSGAGLADALNLFGHDIRSAMSDVIGGLRLVDRSRLPAEALIQIDRVQAAADTLAALIDGTFLTVAGETPAVCDDTMVLSDWLAAIRHRWTGRAMAASRDVVLDISPSLPHALRLPPITLDRIIGNLIGNALAHAPGAAVRMQVAGGVGQGLSLRIHDAGPGYPGSVLARLGPSGDAGPLTVGVARGFGLRIAADLARQIGASLSLSNLKGGGACAVLHLPEDVVVWDAQQAGPRATPPDLSGLRILIAEDNLTNQTILGHILGQMQANVVFVSDGVAALDMLDRRGFDIALIDIEMPRLSGLEVMRRTRARADDVAQMPMVALTAYVLRDNREAIYAAGADGIIGKPITSAAEFGRAILRYAGHPTDLPEPEDVLTGHASLGPKIDHARFNALLAAAGHAGAQELLARLTEDLGAVQTALDAALGRGDVAEIRAQTHILIAISGAVGADRLHHLAEVLNIAAKRRRLGDLAALYAPCRADLVDLMAHVAARSA